MLTIGLSYEGGVIAIKDEVLSVSTNLCIFGFAEMVSYIFGAVYIKSLMRKPIYSVMGISIAVFNIFYIFLRFLNHF